MCLSPSLNLGSIMDSLKPKLQSFSGQKYLPDQDDFVQDVFLKFLSLVRSKHLIFRTREEVEKLLFHCAKYVKKDRHRNSHNFRSSLDSIPSPIAPDRGETLNKSISERPEKVRVLDSLDSASRKIAWYKFALGWREKEIAQEVGLPLTTVRSRIPRLLKKLKAMISSSPPA